MRIIKAGTSGVLIYLEEEENQLLTEEDGLLSRERARAMALRVFGSLRIPCDPEDFSLHAFMGSGGCLLFADGRRHRTQAVFKFVSLEDVTACAARLPQSADASLYFMEGSFFLGLPHCTAGDEAALLEYGTRVENPEEFLSTVAEHGKTISTCGTVEQLRRIG